MIDTKIFYTSRTKEYSEQLKQLKQRSVYISAARLLCFTLLAFFIYLYASHYDSAYSAGIVLSAVAFIIFVRISISLTERKDLAAKLLFINQNETAVIHHGDNSFDNGSFITGLEMHAADLDIFGKRSLYHVLNRTATSHGAGELSGLLNRPPADKKIVIELQQAVTQLSGQADKRQLILAQALLQGAKENNIEEITDWIDTPEKLLLKKWLSIVRVILPLAALSGLLLYLYNNNPIMVGAAVIISWLLTGTFAKYILLQHTLIGKKETVLQQYGRILKEFSAIEEGQSSVLKKIKQTATNARQEILSLSRLSALFDQRLNLLVAIFANSFLLYDIQVMFAMEKWKRKNRMHFLNWINAVGEIEKLNSLATFHFNQPHYIMPVVLDGAPVIEATALGHPLIPGQSQVLNDIIAGRNEKLLLITGSNMSGKSTFLRTIGINTLMAQCGLPVCAATFSFSPMRIISSIRISDSLQENTSYFMAELKRLKEIIDYLDTGNPSLVLIDEVLRGTNSEDKKYGSEELIKKLSGYQCLSVFASHDLSLGVLENELPGKVRNYCFESTIADGELLFDYKLRSGIATNKNASFLMRKMGIIG